MRAASISSALAFVPASALHRIGREDALARLDALFGPAGEWPSPIIQLLLSSEGQADRKEEVGHWLDTAERYGYLQPLVKRVLAQAKRGTRSIGIDPNDERHADLVQELAPAMVAHYLIGTGWSSPRWEPITGGDVDVDLGLKTPARGYLRLVGRGRVSTLLQVKAPDQPGVLENGRIVRTPDEGDERDASGRLRDGVKRGGEADWKILKDVDKAAARLPKTGPEAKLIAVCPNRSQLSSPHACLLPHLYGATYGGREVTLPRSKLGKFWAPEWRHVAGVAVLGFARPAGGDPRYSCVALLNPVSDVRASPDWFPHAHVCVLEADTFRWVRGDPGLPRWLPDGTRVTS